MTITIGQKYRFNYSKENLTIDEYSAHRGDIVMVMRQLTSNEVDPDCGIMYKICAGDGWNGHCFEKELEELKP